VADVSDELEDVWDREDVPCLEGDDVDEQGNSSTDCLVRICCVNKIRFGVACKSIGKCRNSNDSATNADKQRKKKKIPSSPHLDGPLCSCTLYATPIL
jgi:hypothetical protein